MYCFVLSICLLESHKRKITVIEASVRFYTSTEWNACFPVFHGSVYNIGLLNHPSLMGSSFLWFIYLKDGEVKDWCQSSGPANPLNKSLNHIRRRSEVNFWWIANRCNWKKKKRNSEEKNEEEKNLCCNLPSFLSNLGRTMTCNS